MLYNTLKETKNINCPKSSFVWTVQQASSHTRNYVMIAKNAADQSPCTSQCSIQNVNICNILLQNTVVVHNIVVLP